MNSEMSLSECVLGELTENLHRMTLWNVAKLQACEAWPRNKVGWIDKIPCQVMRP